MGESEVLDFLRISMRNNIKHRTVYLLKSPDNFGSVAVDAHADGGACIAVRCYRQLLELCLLDSDVVVAMDPSPSEIL